MAYVSPNCPLPRNSYDPVTAFEAARAKAIVDDMECAVKKAYRDSRMIAGPNAFTSFGPAVVIDVARSQNAMAAADPPVSSKIPNVAWEMMAAPTQLPLNVPVEEYAGCSIRNTGPLLPIPLPPQTLTMPPRLPDPIVVPQFAPAPKYANLCWALRNAAVDASQFNQDELHAAQYRCMQLGYTGACIPPPNVALYLDQQRRAGTLPHIAVRASDLDLIPRAPNLQAVPCPESWKLGGMAGYRGMGSAWGDTSSLPCGGTWGVNKNVGASAGVSGKTLGFLALAVVGLYAMAGKNGRG